MIQIQRTMLGFDKRGLAFNATTLLAKSNSDGRIAMDEHEERTLALLSIAYKSRVPDTVMPVLKKAARDWNEGRRALACIRLAHLGLPEIESNPLHRSQLQKAEQEFDAGNIPEGTIFHLVKTFNPSEPRDARGRWTTGGAAPDSAPQITQDDNEVGPGTPAVVDVNYTPGDDTGSSSASASDDSDNYVTAPSVTSIADAEAIKTKMDGDFYGDTEDCANLTKELAPDVPQHTSLWQRGDLVQGNTDIPIGTAIATFNYYGDPGTNGYGSSAAPGGVKGHSHTGIYLGQDAGGLTMLDQFDGSEGVTFTYFPWDSYNNKPYEAGSRYYTIKAK
jgi:hypothetical protein